jgi:hypothetical protein
VEIDNVWSGLAIPVGERRTLLEHETCRDYSDFECAGRWNMANEKLDGLLSEDARKQIFLALVEAQDQSLGVEESRLQVAQQFSVSSNQVRLIEREGLDEQWPPL